MFPVHRRALLCGVVLAGVLAGAPAARAAQVVDLGDLVPSAISSNQIVVGSTIATDDDDQGGDGAPRLWRDGTTTALAIPSGGTSASPFSVNSSGQAAGSFQGSGQPPASGGYGVSDEAVRWDLSGAAHPIAPAATKDLASDFSFGYDIDEAGDVVGTSYFGSPRYTSGMIARGGGTPQPVGTGDLPADSGATSADAITADGSRILGTTNAGNYEGAQDDSWYLWSGSAPNAPGTKLDILPAGNGVAALGGPGGGLLAKYNALASDGTVLGTKDAGGDDAPRSQWLRLPDGTERQITGMGGINAVNARHEVAGTIIAGGELHAAVWRDGVVTDLNTLLPAGSGFDLFDALVIDDAGDVAGLAANAQGDEVGFLLKRGYVVDTTGDAPDADTTDHTCATAAKRCSLRAAIQQADADGASTQTSISFDVTDGVAAGALPVITPGSALPPISVPVDLDGTTQPGAYVAGSRTIGARIDGSASGAAPDLDLTAGAKGSVVHGLQVEHAAGDAVRLGAAGAQLAGSVLVHDVVGAEVTADGVLVGAGNGLPGDVLFEDGDGDAMLQALKARKGGESPAALAGSLAQFGAGILLHGPSSGTTIAGDLVGIHGAGFGEGSPDPLDPDGPGTQDLTASTRLAAFGVLVDPAGATVSGVRIGGTGADADTISGAGFGVAALPEAGGRIAGLSVLGDRFGTAEDGTALDPVGGLIGLFAAGDVSGLQVGLPGQGNRFQGETIGTLLAGTGLVAPAVQGNTYGTDDTSFDEVSGPKAPLGLHDVVGLLGADVQGAQLGGTDAGQGNALVGDGLGLVLAGDRTADVTVAGDTIGTATPTPFTSFSTSASKDFRGRAGVLLSGTQRVAFREDAIQGDVVGMVVAGARGTTYQDSTFLSDEIGLLDTGSSGERLGTAGHGNVLADLGLGALIGNQQPSDSDLRGAQLNPALVTEDARSAPLRTTNADLGLDAANDVTSAALSPDSTDGASGPGTDERVQGNTFGVRADGTTAPDSLPLVVAGDVTASRVGGTAAGEGNTIAHSRVAGLLLTGQGSHEPAVQVLGNVIYDNESFTETTATGLPGLGIDLIRNAGTGDFADSVGGFGMGVDPQDRTQPDQGPNGVQNAPVLTSATTADGKLTITGTLHGQVSTHYLLELFADDFKNPFGAGEGQTPLGRVEVDTDSAGDASFTSVQTAPPAARRFVSATATTVPGGSAPGVTSEFAVDVPITPAVPPTTTDTTTATTPDLGQTTPAGTTTTAPAGTTTTAPGGQGPETPGTPGAPGAPGTTGAPGTGGGSGGSTPTGVTPQGQSVTTPSASKALTLPAIVTCSSVAATDCAVVATATTPAATSRALVRVVHAAKAKAKAKAKATTVGASRSTVKAGASRRLTLKLTAKGRKLLTAHHRLALTVRVAVGGEGRSTVRQTLRVTVRLKARKR